MAKTAKVKSSTIEPNTANTLPTPAPQKEHSQLAAVQSEPKKPVKVDAKILESLLTNGDLSKLSPEQRVSYYGAVCESLGLNPLTRPFDFLSLNGKIVLYAKRDATDQLRRVYGVSILSLDTRREDGVYIVVASAKDKHGRVDSATGVVAIDNVRGNDLANAIMKAETKAKRRVTLSLCGLGILDESEIETAQSPVIEISTAAITPTVSQAPIEKVPEPTQEAKDTRSEPLPQAAADAPGVPKAEIPTSLGEPAQQSFPEKSAVQTASPTPTSAATSEAVNAEKYVPLLPVPASLAPRIEHIKKFLFGSAQSDDRTIEYLFFCVAPAIEGYVDIETRNKWVPAKWNEAMAGKLGEDKKTRTGGLADRAERMNTIEKALQGYGKDNFLKWAQTLINTARARKLFGSR